MRTRVPIAAFGIAVIIMAGSRCARPGYERGVLAVTNITAVDPTETAPGSSGFRADGGPVTVVLADGRIREIGPAGLVSAPRDASVVDGSGKFLIPGLWDMHVHLSNAGVAALGIEVRNGITGVRDLGSDLAEVDRWRSEIASGRRLGPSIVRVGPMLDGPKPGAAYRLTVTDAGGARLAVDALAALGVDGLEVTMASLATRSSPSRSSRSAAGFVSQRICRAQ